MENRRGKKQRSSQSRCRSTVDCMHACRPTFFDAYKHVGGRAGSAPSQSMAKGLYTLCVAQIAVYPFCLRGRLFCALAWHFSRCNRGLFQRLSGFETGHPAAAGPLPAFDFSVSDEQGVAFLVSVMDCSDCDSSGLDSPNSSWSIVRLKEYLRRKKRPSKREKKPSFLNVIIFTDIVTWNPSLFCFVFVLLLFSLFLFLFSSSPACYAPYFSCTGTQPDKYCFTFSAILFECTQLFM